MQTFRLSIVENASSIVWIYEIIEKEFFSHELNTFLPNIPLNSPKNIRKPSENQRFSDDFRGVKRKINKKRVNIIT